jgi:glycosyltransferase involved in cell wall biosynthesis
VGKGSGVPHMITVGIDTRVLHKSAQGTASYVRGLLFSLRAHGGVNVVECPDGLPRQTVDILHSQILPQGHLREVVTVHDSLVLHHPEMFAGQVLGPYAADFAAMRDDPTRVTCWTHPAVARVGAFSGRKFVVPPSFEGVISPRPGTPPIVMVARDEPRKGISHAIRAYSKFRALAMHRGALYTPEFHIIGVRRNYTTSVQGVRMLPPKDGVSLDAALSGACMVLSTSTHEGFGMVPMHAACLGTPVLCTAASTLFEHPLVNSGGCAVDARSLAAQMMQMVSPRIYPGWNMYYNAATQAAAQLACYEYMMRTIA